MEVFSGFLFSIYFAIILLAGGKTVLDYQMRQLVKANFWINVAIFAMISLLTLMVISEVYTE